MAPAYQPTFLQVQGAKDGNRLFSSHLQHGQAEGVSQMKPVGLHRGGLGRTCSCSGRGRQHGTGGGEEAGQRQHLSCGMGMP
jgi:hypothetical protein